MICVMIERHIAETLEEHYEQNAKNVIQAAIHVPGFISGESLKDTYDPNHRIIWSTWRNIQDWQAWEHSPQRKEMMDVINTMLVGDEKVTILEHT